MAIGTASIAAVTDGATITAPQKAEHAASATPFWSLAQPSHLSGMGRSTDIGMLSAVALAGSEPVSVEPTPAEPMPAEPMSWPAKPCVTRPTAKTRADSKAVIRRVFSGSIRSR